MKCSNKSQGSLSESTKKDLKFKYTRAQALISGVFSNSVTCNATVFPTWIGNTDYFWYERETKIGKEYRLVDSKNGTNCTVFDHSIFSHALSDATKEEVDSKNLPIKITNIEINPRTIHFTAFNKSWIYNSDTEICSIVKNQNYDCIISPNGKLGIFMREFNLWVRDLKNNQEQRLTVDGEENFVYGVGAPSVVGIDYTNVQIRWSPDSTSIFAVQRDSRQIDIFPLIYHLPQDGTLRPQLKKNKVAFPGDEYIETLRLLTIKIESKFIQEANYPYLSMTRSVKPFFDSNLGWWSSDSQYCYFVDVDRTYKAARVVEFNSQTGSTRVLFEEYSKTHISLMLNSDEPPMLVPLPKTKELLWLSERSGWAHLYLYDLRHGQLIKTLTQGDWLVRNIVHVDTKRREVYAQTGGRNAGRDPYYRDLCRINFDTGEITTLASSDHEYWAVTQQCLGTVTAKSIGRDVGNSCAVSPSGNFFVVTRSRADVVPSTILLDRNAENIRELEIADISALPTGWQWPEPVRMASADGNSDIYGLVFRPSDFSPDYSYPVISHIYNSPDLTWVSKGSFSNGPAYGISYLDAAALAELGFIVVQIDGRGSPFRRKKFFDECYGWAESASNIDDHVSGIKQLCERFDYMDLNRVGITSHCAGGMGVVSAMCNHANFYKVGIASMLYDSRFLDAAMWGEKYEGSSSQSVARQYPEELVENLQGKLLLMNSLIDPLAPAAGTIRIINALQKANKDFDLLLLPSPSHSYLVRRAWDYLAKHLLGVKPPDDFRLTTNF